MLVSSVDALKCRFVNICNTCDFDSSFVPSSNIYRYVIKESLAVFEYAA